jgi:hypothetical protein
LWKMNEDGLVNLVGNWSKPHSDRKTAFSIHEEPISFSDSSEVIAQTIKETNKKLRYEISVEYPQVTNAPSGRFDKFNQECKSLINREVAGFRKEMNDRAAEQSAETPSEGTAGSDLGAGYTIAIANDNLISVQFDIGGYYEGAAHPNSHSAVINFDAKNGKVLKLADLFKPGAKYLQAISAYCIKDLKSQAKGPDAPLTAETIAEGAGPQAKNFQSWTIERKGLAIAFDAYQVGPYVAGPQRVLIPYAALREMINPDGALAEFLN